MSEPRTEILAKVRRALGERLVPREQDYHAIPRAYRQDADVSPEACLDLWISRLEHYDGRVYRCSSRDVAPTIAQALAARGKRRIVIPGDLPREWLPEGFDFVVDANLGYSDLDRADGVLTGCTLAIALTGTIVLQHRAGEGRRALSLIPDYHLCVVRTEQIVYTVPEAFRRLGSHAGLLTTISGPSATSDIEMTRIKGVHGPRTLEIALMES